MKTLRELGIEPSHNLLRRLEINSEQDAVRISDTLSQREAVEEECGWTLGDVSWFDWFENIVHRYGGKIVFDGDDQK